MPFELGLDYGCKKYKGTLYSKKRMLVLEEQKHRYQAVLSDLSGCDIEVHNGDFEVAIRKVRNWVVNAAEVNGDGPTKIVNAYYDFQEWDYERLLAKGFSDEDIKDYPTPELLSSMRKWIKLGKPV